MQNVPNIVRERLKAAQPAVHHPDADLLTAFAEQSLPEAERAAVLEHLARCGDCRDVVAIALPATEALATVATPARGGWLTWPALRWGFVAAGIVTIASLGILHYQRRSEQSTMAYKSQDLKLSVPENEVKKSEVEKTAPLLIAPAPTQKLDVPPPATAVVVNGAVAGSEPKRIAPAAPSSPTAHPLHGSTAGGLIGGSGTYGGPKSPSFQFNNNSQQQVLNNAAPTPTVNLPADQPSSAKQMPPAGETATVEVTAEDTVINTETSSVQRKSRDQSADSQKKSANPIRVDKAKLADSPALGQILGYVVDPSGAVVPNARITLTPAGTGGTATAVTNSQGAWLIAGLPTGNYKALAEAPGFRTTVRDFSYDAKRPSLYSFTLSPGSVSETVEVSSAQTAQVQTEGANVGGPISNYAVSQVPLNGRTFTPSAAPSAGPLPRWTISSTGALQRSFDQGISWQSVDVNASAASFDRLEVFAKESRGKEKDANQKVLKREATPPVFRAVTAAGSDVWAGGSGGAFYHSIDAGNTWTRVVPASAGSILTGDIVALQFPDPQHGTITTSTPEVWTTSDAGQTWQKQ